MESKSRLTLPEMARALGITRAKAERLVMQYGDRLGPIERNHEPDTNQETDSSK